MLVPAFVLSFYTGVILHIAGHGTDHETWHNRAVFHSIASLLFMLLGIIHLRSHWGWYKSLRTAGCKGKRKVVLLLSAVFLSVVITGLSLLLFVDGADSPMGLLHYKAGIVMGVLGVFHILRRKRFLYRGFKDNIPGKKKKRE